MNDDLKTAMERVDPRAFATRGDYRLRMLAELLAVKLERRRDRNERLKRILLEIRSAIRNEGRVRYLDNWERALSEGWPSVKRILQGGDERSLELLHSFPFPGEVDEDDRLRILLRSHGRPQSELPDLKRRLAEAEKRIENNVVRGRFGNARPSGLTGVGEPPRSFAVAWFGGLRRLHWSMNRSIGNDAEKPF